MQCGRQRPLVCAGLLVGAILAVCCPASATDATDLLFEQTNFIDSHGVVAEANSLWGGLTFSYDPDPAVTQYLNVSLGAAARDPTVWAVRNLPLPYVDNGVFDSRRETVDISLALLGYAVGDDWTDVDYAVSVTPTVQSSAPAGGLSHASVCDYDYSLWSASTEVLAAGFTGGVPAGVAIADPAGPRVYARHDLRHVDEGDSKCMAGAFARSLDWLNRRHNLGLADIATIYDGLVDEGVSVKAWYEFYWTAHANYINAKQAYLTANASGRVITKVIDLTGAVAGTPGTTQQEGGDLYQWLVSEWQHGEDIEISYAFTDDEGNFLGRHIAAVVDISFDENGTPVLIRIQDDGAQGEAGGRRIRDLSLMRDWYPGPQAYEYYLGSRNRRIEFAVSESVPEPGALVLLALGGAALIRRRRRG